LFCRQEFVRVPPKTGGEEGGNHLTKNVDEALISGRRRKRTKKKKNERFHNLLTSVRPKVVSAKGIGTIFGQKRIFGKGNRNRK
jgi:hypothetical protein